MSRILILAGGLLLLCFALAFPIHAQSDTRLIVKPPQPSLLPIEEPLTLTLTLERGIIPATESVSVEVVIQSAVQGTSTSEFAQSVPDNPDQFTVTFTTFPSEGAYHLSAQATSESIAPLASTRHESFFEVYHTPRLLPVQFETSLYADEMITLSVPIEYATKLLTDTIPTLKVYAADASGLPIVDTLVERNAEGQFTTSFQLERGEYVVQASLPPLLSSDRVLLDSQTTQRTAQLTTPQLIPLWATGAISTIGLLGVGGLLWRSRQYSLLRQRLEASDPTELQQRLTEAEIQLDELQQRLTETETQLEKVKGERDTHTNTIQELNSKNHELESSLNRFKRRHKSTTDFTDKLLSQLQQLGRDYVIGYEDDNTSPNDTDSISAETLTASIIEQFESNKAQIVELQQKIGELSASIELMEQKNEELETQLQECQTDAKLRLQRILKRFSSAE